MAYLALGLLLFLLLEMGVFQGFGSVQMDSVFGDFGFKQMGGEVRSDI